MQVSKDKNLSKNSYALPIDRGKFIRMTYDESPAHKFERHQYAVDFVATIGTPINASADGVVLFVRKSSNYGSPQPQFGGFGNFILIKHVNNEFTTYEHLDFEGAMVKVGDHVKKGQEIARSGATGWLADLGPHLHFEVGTYEGDVGRIKSYNDLKRIDPKYKCLKIKWEE